jgi:hypothetical protein
MMQKLLHLRDDEDATEVLLKILVPLDQYVPQPNTGKLCRYLVEHVQGTCYSHQSRRDAALCLVVLVAIGKPHKTSYNVSL